MIKPLLNPSIQILNIALGIIPAFIYPLIFGLEFYGSFIQSTALIYFLAFYLNTSFDLYFMKISANYIESGVLRTFLSFLFKKITFATLLGAGLLLLQDVNMALANIGLLISMVSSSLALSYLFLINNKKNILCVLLFSMTTLIVIVYLASYLNSSVYEFILLLIPFNLLITIIGILLTHPSWGWDNKKKGNIDTKLIFSYLLISSGNNFIVNGITLISSFLISIESLGLFKIGISIVQAATSIFPVNLKTIFTVISKLPYSSSKVTYFKSCITLTYWLFIPMSVLPLLLSILAINLDIPCRYIEYLHSAEVLIPLSPAIVLFFISSIMEKSLLAISGERKVVKLNIVLISLMTPTTFLLIYYYGIAGSVLSYTFSCLIYVGIGFFMNLEISKQSKPHFIIISLMLALSIVFNLLAQNEYRVLYFIIYCMLFIFFGVLLMKYSSLKDLKSFLAA